MSDQLNPRFLEYSAGLPALSGIPRAVKGAVGADTAIARKPGEANDKNQKQQAITDALARAKARVGPRARVEEKARVESKAQPKK